MKQVLIFKSVVHLIFFQHVLEVEAHIGSYSSSAEVEINVRDANDHSPVFSRAVHETQITEEDDRHLPKTILTVSFIYLYI